MICFSAVREISTRQAKAALGIPIIGSLNAVSSGGWIRYAKLIQQAGADALELNIYFIPTDAGLSSAEIEQMYLELKAGRVDVIMTNPMKTYLEFLSKPDGAGFEVIGPQIDEEKYFGTGAGVGIRKGEEALLKRIDAALIEMKKDGTLDAFSKKYFPFAIYPTN